MHRGYVERSSRPEETTREPVVFGPDCGAAELELVQGPRPGRRFALCRRSTVIGKSGAADLQLVAHGMSRLHAKVLLLDDGPTVAVNIVDLGSTNGTFLNRRRIDMALMRDGDRLQLGAHVTLVLSRRRAALAEPDDAVVLTPRQLEVARLVAAGARNAEVARTLEVSPRTVSGHLERIYEALGMGSRAELTRWLVEQDLHVEPAR
ncbi:MAG: LuxR C-terminal-related transcriptional regulator [Deltaproteobacteria bacterium]|nr:LuxR C-terminal-related transcriptional regulator [Deltaproteobacteria bacterium]